MSLLLDNGPHRVTIYIEEVVEDSYGNSLRRPSETAVEVTGCTITPIRTSRDPGSDRRVSGDAFRFLARSAPLGRWSRVVWNGRVLHVESGPDQHDVTPETAHISATLVAES